MPSDYKAICQDNIRRRGEEFDDMGRLISEQLYSDRSHFVYELLQNAEDALERRLKQNPDNCHKGKVQFSLCQDRLEFRHFGALFNEEDVKGISDVLKGTKKEDDLTQIGKFGIGFKSVYAFTASPEIHSGDEHFVIKRYIRPEAKDPEPALSITPAETVFIFPFDHKELSAKNAFDLILNKLRGLGPRVLLFLRRIVEIEWKVEPDGEGGHYVKEAEKVNGCKIAHRVTVIGQKNEQEEMDEEIWLSFERPVTVLEKSGQVPVEVGFRIETNTKDKTESIIRIDRSPLVVYFPTEKDTGLGFLIQGPYRTTPARDNIPGYNDWNKKLIVETAALIVESLRQLKEMGLLSVSLVEALPIRRGDDFFYPIFNKVSEALMNEEFLPASDGTFVAARNAKIARGEELRELLNKDQLRALFQSEDEIKWLEGTITLDRTPALRSYLMKELEVEEVTPEVFARKLSEQFLTQQSDEWIIKFYKFLSGHKALWPSTWKWDLENRILRNKPILRLQDGTHVNPFRDDGSPNAYLAAGTDTETSLPIVKVELSEHQEIRKFLNELGIPELDLVAEVIENLLPKYRDDSILISIEDNKRDLVKIKRAYETDFHKKKDRLQKHLQKTPFILAESPSTGKTIYRKPNEVYFGNDELRMYFAGNDSFACVSRDHPHSTLFKDLKVKETVRVYRRESNFFDGYVSIGDSHGWHQRGHKGFDPDIYVDGLECALSTLSLCKSRFIWNKIAIPNSDCIRGIVETSTRYTYEGSNTEEKLSEFGKLLIDTAWLPDLNGDIRKPSELALDDLPELFIRDEKLAEQLGMKKNIVAKLAEEAGISESTLDLARQIEDCPPTDRRQIHFLLQKLQKNQAEFPQKSTTNPEQRQKRLAKQLNDAREREYETWERSVRTSRGAIEPSVRLRNEYTDDSGQMICQICKEEMPFKKPDGEYYFEAVEALAKDYFPQEHEAQFLALCPLCAAMYKIFIKQDDSAMQNIHHVLHHSDELNVPLKLGEWETSIRFVENHRLDMRTILQDGQE